MPKKRKPAPLVSQEQIAKQSKKRPARKKKKRESSAKGTAFWRRRLFVAEYVKDFNGKGAAVRAGYSEKTAAQQAHRLLDDPRVRSEIDAEKARLIKELHYSADHLHHDMVTESLADPADMLNDDGSFKPLTEWPLALRRRIKSVKFEEGVIKDIVFTDNTPKQALIGKLTAVHAFKEVIRSESDIGQLMQQVMGASITPPPANARYVTPDDEEDEE